MSALHHVNFREGAQEDDITLRVVEAFAELDKVGQPRIAGQVNVDTLGAADERAVDVGVLEREPACVFPELSRDTRLIRATKYSILRFQCEICRSSES